MALPPLHGGWGRLMAFEGTLKDFSLGDIVQLIALQRKTGVLTLEGTEDAATIFFQDGAVVWARSRRQVLGDRMRRVLRLRGLVTEERLAEAERVQAETGKGLGAVLAERRFLSKEEWQRAVALEVQDLLHRVFRWRDGTYRFEVRTALDLSEGRIAPLASETVLLESFRQLDEWPPIARRIPRTDGILSLLRPADKIDRTSLSPEEGRILEFVDGRARVADVMDASALGEFEACKALAAVMEAGIVGLAPPAGAPALAQPERAAWTGWVPWGGLALWLALNLLVFRPWVLVVGPPPSADLLKQVRARAGMAALAWRLDQSVAEVGSLPPDLGGLVRRGMVDSAALKDPWGRPYRYEVQGARYVLRSTGP